MNEKRRYPQKPTNERFDEEAKCWVFDPDAPDPLDSASRNLPASERYDEETGCWEFDPEAGCDLSDSTGYLGNINAKAGVAEWVVEDVGNRPIDHMVRDLMHGSLLRNWRPKWFHNYCRHPSKWMHDLLDANLPDAARCQALQHLALHFLHKGMLVRLLRPFAEVSPGSRLEDPNYLRLCRMWVCRPHGVLCRRANNDETAPEVYCDIARFCPWCHARKVVDLYTWLAAGPLRDPTGKLLVQARVTLNSVNLGLSEEEERVMKEIGSQSTTAWWCQGSFRNIYRRLWPSMVEQMQRAGNALRQHALAAGVQGGLIAYQVGPDRHSKFENSFSHELTLLGEVPCRTDEERSAFERRIGVGDDAGNDGFSWNDGVAALNWLVLPASEPNALRYLLAGSSTNYPVYKLNLSFHETHPGLLGLAKNGIPGVLGLQPAFMFDPFQWHSCFDSLKGTHLYNRFGSWHGQAAKAEKTRASKVSPGPEMPKGPGRGKSLCAVNAARGAASRSRREKLLLVVRSLHSEVSAETTRRRGRPATRKALGDKLANRGHRVSDRDLQWLQNMLRESPGT